VACPYQKIISIGVEWLAHHHRTESATYFFSNITGVSNQTNGNIPYSVTISLNLGKALIFEINSRSPHLCFFIEPWEPPFTPRKVQSWLCRIVKSQIQAQVLYRALAIFRIGLWPKEWPLQYWIIAFGGRTWQKPSMGYWETTIYFIPASLAMWAIGLASKILLDRSFCLRHILSSNWNIGPLGCIDPFANPIIACIIPFSWHLELNTPMDKHAIIASSKYGLFGEAGASAPVYSCSPPHFVHWILRFCYCCCIKGVKSHQNLVQYNFFHFNNNGLIFIRNAALPTAYSCQDYFLNLSHIQSIGKNKFDIDQVVLFLLIRESKNGNILLWKFLVLKC